MKKGQLPILYAAETRPYFLRHLRVDLHQRLRLFAARWGMRKEEAFNEILSYGLLVAEAEEQSPHENNNKK